MDAIECGIVKLPRVPVADNIPGGDMPMFRNLWEHIGKKMPKKGRGKAGELDPLEPAAELQTALEALYGHYEKTFDALAGGADRRAARASSSSATTPSTSKLVYDYISGFQRENDDGIDARSRTAASALFRNFDEHGNPLAAPEHAADRQRAARIRRGARRGLPRMAADEIERFRREIVERTGDRQRGREHHRPGPAARGDEHRRQARAGSASRSAASSPSRC